MHRPGWLLAQVLSWPSAGIFGCRLAASLDMLFARLFPGGFICFHFLSAGLEQDGFNRDNSANPF
jgi:hypothetical protein